MSLLNYHAVQKALELSNKDDSGWKITPESVKKIDGFFEEYLDDPKFVLIPRFNGTCLSFRYCGLEVLQLTGKGVCQRVVGEEKCKLRRLRKPIALESLENLKPCIDKTRAFLNEYRKRFCEKPRFKKQERYIPGFSLEHWLESIILADSPIGKNAREFLGINIALTKVVSQVPIILNPKGGQRKKRHHHIDLLSVNSDESVTVIELKKDNDFAKAKKELEEYTNWILERGSVFDRERGKPEKMEKEHYLPKANYHLAVKDIKAVAVILNPCSSMLRLENGVELKIVKLAPQWLTADGSLFLS